MNFKISIPQKMRFMKPIETFWNQLKSSFSQFLYKTKNISQNLNVPKTQDTTKSKTKLKVSSKLIPKISLYKIKNLLGNDSRYTTISHKKCFVPKVSVSDFVADVFGGMVFINVYYCFTNPIISLPIYWRSTAESRAQKKRLRLSLAAAHSSGHLQVPLICEDQNRFHKVYDKTWIIPNWIQKS